MPYWQDAGVRFGRLAALVTVLAVALAGCAARAADTGSLVDSFEGPDGLVAAEGRPAIGDSPWVMTSGSLFRSAGMGWTGVPDDGQGGRGTGSAVFRMVSRARDFGDVRVSLRLKVVALGETDRTPAQDYDGAHVWLRYKSDRELYAVSVDRRDGTMIVKKKCPGGDSNGGTYYDLSDPVTDAAIPFGTWQQVTASARDRADGSVEITANRDGWQLHAVDHGQGCPPLRGTGGVGLRGDNAELYFDDVVAQPLPSG
jgi:hypothetical protein